ncbi:hypothetical protein Aduo_011958 [Ancylostoma duodenale]
MINLQLRKLDHDNVNKFLGLSFDGMDYVVVWRLCSRGSLLAMLSRSVISTDSFFVQCIIRDVAEVIIKLKLLDMRVYN